LDVNVVLDFVFSRPRFVAAATALWAAAERKRAELLIPAHGVTTIFYIVARQRGASFARRVLGDLLLVPRVARVDDAIVRRALSLGWTDFEDAVCAAAAEAGDCDLLVTRDPAGFDNSPVLVVDPPTALSLLGQSPGPDRVSEAPSTVFAKLRRGRPGRRGRLR
jgi:predicted nucleic acid-binding protein